MGRGAGEPAQAGNESERDQGEEARPGRTVGRRSREAGELVPDHDEPLCTSFDRRPLDAGTDSCEGGFSRLGGPTWSCAEWQLY